MPHTLYMLTLLLLLSMTQPTADKTLEHTYAFRRAAIEAWGVTANGKLAREAGFVVYSNGLTSGIESNDARLGHGELVLPITHNAFAYVHSHPNSLEDRPSVADRAIAKRIGKPIYVISRSGLWEACPTGEIVLVFEGTGWMR